MEQSDMIGQSADQPGEAMYLPSNLLSPAPPRGPTLSPQIGEATLPPNSDASGTPYSETTTAATPYVYALGRVEPRFPSLALEKEFIQATGRANTAGLSDRQALHNVLSQRQNRYLARQLCYVFT